MSALQQNIYSFLRLTLVIGARYADFSPTLVAEKLAEEHAKCVSVGLVRELMMASEQWAARWREKAVLIALFDDAISEVGYAASVEQETTATVFCTRETRV